MIERLLCRGFHKTLRGPEEIYILDKKIKGIWYEGYVYIRNKNGEPEYRIKICDSEGVVIPGKEYSVVKESVGMFSGFKDSSSGVKIFENDIVDGKYKDFSPKKNRRFIVGWEKGSFVELALCNFSEVTIVGNMFNEDWDLILEEGFDS